MVRVDELTASGHLDHQDDDLAAVASLGIDVWRYGMPWRLTEPESGVYDWSLWDRALAACDRHGLEPVIDLCHFGLPDHYAGFGDLSWVDGFARYVDAFLAHSTLANLEAIARISADRDGWWIGAEAFGCHVAVTPEDEPAAAAARELDQLTWDLHVGVDPPSSVADVVDAVAPEVLARISDLAGLTTASGR